VAVGGAGALGQRLSRRAAWTLGMALGVQATVLAARVGPLARSDYLRHSWAARAVLERTPALYGPAPEVFVERTLGHEREFEGPVVYRDGVGRCRKAWLQPRHLGPLVLACGELAASGSERLRAAARDAETKRDWSYVDF
jgi:hypothetical protein